MKIVSCFMEEKEIAPLIEAGADELYTSVPGLPSFDETYLRGISIENSFKKIHALGKKALVAVNSPQIVLDTSGLKKLERRLHALDGAGADAFIISSPSLLSLLSSSPRRLRAALHLSSVQPCFNTAALRFFLRFGIRRLILPTQLPALEAADVLKLCRREGVETEIFDYRFFGCNYVNGRCNMHLPRFHTFKKGAKGGALCRCGGPRQALPVKPLGVNPERAGEVPAIARRLALRMGGGGAPRFYNAASFFDFFTLGVGWLKYGVRADPPAVKARKVGQLRAMADLAGTLIKERGPRAARALFIERMTAWRGV